MDDSIILLCGFLLVRKRKEWVCVNLMPRKVEPARGAKTSYMTLKVYSFIGRLIRHIPDKHFPMIRYAGIFPNRWKKQYLAQARIALGLAESDDSNENTKSLWAERQTRFTGINPLQCPNCDKPLIFVGCFFGNWNQLQHLFE